MTARWVVRCDDYTTKPYRTQADAERAVERIVRQGACRHAHEVIEVRAGREM